MAAGDGGASAATPTGRQHAYGIGFIAVVLALLVEHRVWLLATADACGCTTPTDLVVYNADTRPATVTWRHPGLLGTPILGRSETVEVAACTTGDLALAVGHDDVSISSSTATTELAVEVPDGHGGYAIPIVLVHAGGFVERLPAPLAENRVPGESGCGG